MSNQFIKKIQIEIGGIILSILTVSIYILFTENGASKSMALTIVGGINLVVLALGMTRVIFLDKKREVLK